ncbi:hypothetical protein [Burkholderia cepacia]|uniref:hypothetical protein n=1 Tax=Burkholderia cepacia TaxID=292 RepID=UPI0020198A4C|nr:hypothetical protein [Burkholderia cepacia]UQO35482.1 hypothetical protein L0Z22_07010 [Burkholderia cepacia]UQO45794.1 hypothetical protein L0Z05_08810 [Burkholderia cepacia]UQP10878.1 hypothetical protein L0Z01_22560 [Burkholderia cepacia]
MKRELPEFRSPKSIARRCLPDRQLDNRHDWLRDEQTPRVTPSEPARQSNFEKSAIFRWTIVAALLFVAVNIFQDDPVVAPTTAYHVAV